MILLTIKISSIQPNRFSSGVRGYDPRKKKLFYIDKFSTIHLSLSELCFYGIDYIRLHLRQLLTDFFSYDVCQPTLL